MNREALLIPYVLGRTVAFLILRKPKGYLLWVFFVILLTFFLYIENKISYKEAVVNVLNLKR
jgi:hypothetical protein